MKLDHPLKRLSFILFLGCSLAFAAFALLPSPIDIHSYDEWKDSIGSESKDRLITRIDTACAAEKSGGIEAFTKDFQIINAQVNGNEYDFNAAVAKQQEDELKGALYPSTGNADVEAKLQALSARTGLPVEAVKQNQGLARPIYDFNGAVDKQKEDEIKQSLYATFGNPNEEAEIQALAKRRGLSVEAVRQDFKGEKFRDKIDNFDYRNVVMKNLDLTDKDKASFLLLLSNPDAVCLKGLCVEHLNSSIFSSILTSSCSSSVGQHHHVTHDSKWLILDNLEESTPWPLIALAASFLFLFMSLLYDRVIGPVVKWVRTGLW
jgi:hypothetical protein